MKKMFVAVLLASAAIAACGGKKASTTPQDKAPQEMNGDPTGGSMYGGHKAEPAAKGTPNPCATK
jgi:hypothetical protein